MMNPLPVRVLTRQSLSRSWRFPSVRCQHAEPAISQQAGLEDFAHEQTTAWRPSSIRPGTGFEHKKLQPTEQDASDATETPRFQKFAPGTLKHKRLHLKEQGARDATATRYKKAAPGGLRLFNRAKNQGGALRVAKSELRIHSDGPLLLKTPPDLEGFGTPFIDTDGQLKGYKKGGTFVVPGRWLREMCTCSECRHPDTAQKKINVLQSGDFGRVTRIKETKHEKTGDLAFGIDFADGHRSTIPATTITNRSRGSRLHDNRAGRIPITPWTSSISTNPPSVEYPDIQSGNGMSTLLLKLRQYGFCFIHSTPPSPTATEKLLESIGPIRNTHYGAFYDFTSDLSSKDTAYTSEALDPHTDNTYFTEPAGLQALHLLSHTSGATSAFPGAPDDTDTDSAGEWEPGLGGESSLVDGFAAANHLFHTNPDAYRHLSSYGVHAHASGNEGISIQPASAYPPFQHDWLSGKLFQIRWNTADRAGTMVPWDQMDEWYDAAAEFDELVRSQEFQYEFSLNPGTVLIFDNWRVMHGRKAFTGKRRMCGGYIPRDDWVSKFKALNLSREEIKRSTVTG